MADRPEDLPEFADPPVVEVVLGVQFESIRQLRQSHFGRFWGAIGGDYPLTTDHPRLETPVLSLDPESKGPSFQLEMLDSPPTHRSWFVSADDERLVQLQDDRLIHNWRHRGGVYPRFEPLRDQFWNAVNALRSVLEESGIPRPQPRQVEVTYINWISGAQPSEYLRPAGNASISVEDVGPTPEFEHWIARYPVRAAGSTAGHLSIESKPAARRNDEGAAGGYLLSLTYLAPTGVDATDEDVDEHLARGRDVIVKSFAAVTKEDMHLEAKWGRLK